MGVRYGIMKSMSENAPEPHYSPRENGTDFSESFEKSIRGSAEVSDREPEPGFVGQSMSLQSYDEDD